MVYAHYMVHEQYILLKYKIFLLGENSCVVQ